MEAVAIVRRTAAIALLAALAACSSGGAPPVPQGSSPGGGTNPGTSVPNSAARVTFTMHWSSTAPAAASVRKPAYVPATAQSVSVAVNGSTPQYLNAPSTTLTISAPPGVDTFAFNVYDEQNGQGNVLSTADITQTVVIDTANVVSATLNGVIASLSLSLGTPKPPAGTAAAVPVTVAALDADGNVIVGPGGYNTPIKLAFNDPANSGTLSLSATLIQAPGGTAPTLNYSGGTLATATITAAATGAPPVSATFAPAPTFYQISIPSGALPQWITAGPDGNMWYTDSRLNTVNSVTPAGVVTSYPLPTANASPQQIVSATDGNLWFTEYAVNKIAKVTPTGTVTEQNTLFFGSTPADNPYGIVDRGDGTVWYVGNGADRLGYIGISSGTSGETTLPESPTQVFPYSITTAPDNNLYFTETASPEKIGRISNLFGTVQETAITVGSGPRVIVRGPDGNLWFTEFGTNKIAKFSPSSFSVIAEYNTVTPNSQPVGLCVGQDGALWFTETGLDAIGRVTTSGVVSEYKSPVGGLRLQGIAAAPDGSLWFVEPGNGTTTPQLGKLVY